ncbi:hypothetical protein F8M41_009000 [Gigaspora margarita]|uniref:Uncharacterized protein n=1 Tax=Gigaspora margarita TaxID=4874 RepID=A0A8H4AVC1_GIGMA|nr:hypothetical protein F8M41_009000 [Gigaspora margarita]
MSANFAIDTIYKSQYNKYVSEINLAASTIKYTIAWSKIIIDIDNHISGGGGYTKFVNWIKSLVVEPKSLPNGLLILAFDNEQKGQKNYLDQVLTINLWKSRSLSEDNINQLLYLNNDMNKILEIELLNFINEIIKELSENINKTIVFKSYEPKKPSVELQNSKISITQRAIANHRVKVPDLYVSDPILVNPNSLKNVQKVLEHIEIITNIKSRKHKWMPVIYNGVLYNQALKLKQQFPWLILLPDALHEEMNMLKAFVELN